MSDVARCSVSLFSGGGFGDIGVEYGAGVPILAMCELLPERANVLRRLFPNACVHCGDIWECKQGVVDQVRRHLGEGKRPQLLVMSPPCQGMSSNGVGRILSAVARKQRPELDPRNRLLLPAIEVVEALQPEWIVLENVRNMRNTVIMNEFDVLENVLDVLRRRLANYDIRVEVLDAASFGVPQRRERLITIGRRSSHATARSYHPDVTHGPGKLPHVTLHAATRHLPDLDALSKRVDEFDPLHRIPEWSHLQYMAMSHTPEGHTAFDNDSCVRCRTRVDDPRVAVCPTCTELMPRPLVKKSYWRCKHCASLTPRTRTVCGQAHARSDEEDIVLHDVIRAFKTAYRRMHHDRPSSTLTTNSGVISSDVKGHPHQNRVLSLREVLIVASLSSHPGFDAPWAKAESTLEGLPDRCIRHIAGESIPPLVMFRIVRHLLSYDADVAAAA